MKNKNFSKPLFYKNMYKDKKYKKEINFIINKIRDLSKKNIIKGNTNILDLGCGVGGHSEKFADAGFIVTSVDINRDMLNTIPKNKKITTYHSDILTINLKKKFQIIVSLFHVINYINKKDIFKFFEICSKHLDKNHYLVLDSWHASAVINLKPISTSKEFIYKNTKIIRKSKSLLNTNKDQVKVRHDFFAKSIHQNNFMFHEIHNMSYYSITELKNYASLFNLKLIKTYNNFSNTQSDINSWSVSYFFKKINN